MGTQIGYGEAPMARVGERLRGYREARGWSQEELSRRLGLTRMTISRYESGERQIQADMLPAIAEALGVHPARFFLEDGEVVTPAPRSPGAERMLRELLERQGYAGPEIEDVLEWLDWRRWRRAQA
jgi:transcriptional regulator with XRE-family HTH domain